MMGGFVYGMTWQNNLCKYNSRWKPLEKHRLTGKGWGGPGFLQHKNTKKTIVLKININFVEYLLKKKHYVHFHIFQNLAHPLPPKKIWLSTYVFNARTGYLFNATILFFAWIINVLPIYLWVARKSNARSNSGDIWPRRVPKELLYLSCYILLECYSNTLDHFISTQ